MSTELDEYVLRQQYFLQQQNQQRIFAMLQAAQSSGSNGLGFILPTGNHCCWRSTFVVLTVAVVAVVVAVGEVFGGTSSSLCFYDVCLSRRCWDSLFIWKYKAKETNWELSGRKTWFWFLLPTISGSHQKIDSFFLFSTYKVPFLFCFFHLFYQLCHKYGNDRICWFPARLFVCLLTSLQQQKFWLLCTVVVSR